MDQDEQNRRAGSNVSGTALPAACQKCPMAPARFERGLRGEQFDFLIALAGNPNTGKSSIFNWLTGLRQHVGNWPGKTVTKAEGGFVYGGKAYKLVDLPGTYSLLSASEDEEIARNFLLFGQPDATIVVADATALERNLNLLFQVMEISDKVVLALNLMDEAKRKGLEVNVPGLSRRLGIPVVPTVARTGEGLLTLVDTVHRLVHGEIQAAPIRPQPDPAVEEAVQELVNMIDRLAPGLPNARWVAYRLLEGDLRIQQALFTGELVELARKQRQASVEHPALLGIQGRQ